MKKNRTDNIFRTITVLICSVLSILVGILFLDGFQPDAWVMKAPWLNDAVFVCCFGLYIVGVVGTINSVISLLDALIMEPDEPEMTLEEARQPDEAKERER